MLTHRICRREGGSTHKSKPNGLGRPEKRAQLPFTSSPSQAPNRYPHAWRTLSTASITTSGSSESQPTRGRTLTRLPHPRDAGVELPDPEFLAGCNCRAGCRSTEGCSCAAEVTNDDGSTTNVLAYNKGVRVSPTSPAAVYARNPLSFSGHIQVQRPPGHCGHRMQRRTHTTPSPCVSHTNRR